MNKYDKILKTLYNFIIPIQKYIDLCLPYETARMSSHTVPIYSQWGLIPRPSRAVAVAICNTYHSMVVNPTDTNFLTERTSSIL